MWSRPPTEQNAAVINLTTRQWLIALTAGAAALRFPTLDVQSFWFDESATAATVLRSSLADTLSQVRDFEVSPPLYSTLAWGWAKLFGTGEVGLRSLSALLGTALVPAAYAATSALAGRRAGIFAAALVATSPLLVWYSQEARAYALHVLLATLALWLFTRALRDDDRRALRGWAAVAVLALWTHYFAIFLILPQALWLLVRRAGRRTWAAVGVVALGGLLVLPLAVHQQRSGRGDFIGETSMTSRLVDVGKRFLTGQTGAPGEVGLGVALGVLVLVAAWMTWRRPEGAERRGMRVALLLAIAILATPLALAIVGLDYFHDRNVLAALPLLAVVLGIGLGSRRAGSTGIVVAGGICALGIVVSVAVPLAPEMQRDDWRSAVRAIGPPSGDRVLLLNPGYAAAPLFAYDHPVGAFPRTGARIRELVWIGTSGPPGREPPLAGFRRVETRRSTRVVMIRFRSAAPRRVTWGELMAAGYPDEFTNVSYTDPGASRSRERP